MPKPGRKQDEDVADFGFRFFERSLHRLLGRLGHFVLAGDARDHGIDRLFRVLAGRTKIGFGGDHPRVLGAVAFAQFRELALRVRNAVDVDVRIGWDATKPDGTPRKALDSRRLAALGWKPAVSFDEGLRLACADFAARRVRA